VLLAYLLSGPLVVLALTAGASEKVFLGKVVHNGKLSDLFLSIALSERVRNKMQEKC